MIFVDLTRHLLDTNGDNSAEYLLLDDDEIESENEKDRAFLDDEVSGNDPSFYRRLNVQLDTEKRQERRRTREEIADCEDMLFGEVKTSDNKVLNELAQKVNAYLSELLVLG